MVKDYTRHKRRDTTPSYKKGHRRKSAKRRRKMPKFMRKARAGSHSVKKTVRHMQTKYIQ